MATPKKKTVTAKKTSATGKTRAKKQAPVPVDEDGFMCLQGELLWKYRAVDAEYRNTVLAMDGKQREILEELKKYPDLQRMVGERDALTISVRLHQNELIEVYKVISDALHIADMTNVSIDDRTGRVFVLDDGKQIPVKPVKPKTRRKTVH